MIFVFERVFVFECFQIRIQIVGMTGRTQQKRAGDVLFFSKCRTNIIQAYVFPLPLAPENTTTAGNEMSSFLVCMANLEAFSLSLTSILLLVCLIRTEDMF